MYSYRVLKYGCLTSQLQMIYISYDIYYKWFFGVVLLSPHTFEPPAIIVVRVQLPFYAAVNVRVYLRHLAHEGREKHTQDSR